MDYICQICEVDCLSEKLLALHTNNTSCGFVGQPPPLPDWQINLAPVLTFKELIERLADKFHYMNEEVEYGYVKDRDRIDIGELAKRIGMSAAAVKCILVSRDADELDCIDADRILRGMGIDLRDLIAPQDYTAVPKEWSDRRKVIRGLTRDAKAALAGIRESVVTVMMALDDPGWVRVARDLELTIENLIQTQEGIERTLDVDWNVSQDVSPELPKSKSQYRKELMIGLKRSKRLESRLPPIPKIEP